MDAKHKILAAVILWIFSGYDLLSAKEYKFPQYIRLSVREVSPSDQMVCKKIVRSIGFHLGSFGRYKLVRRGRTLNRLGVYCQSNGTIKLTFSSYTKTSAVAKPKKILISEVSKTFDPRTQSTKVFSLGILKELIAKLPWSGEVTSIVSVDPPKEKPGEEAKKVKKEELEDFENEKLYGESYSDSIHFVADTSTGYITNDVPDVCLPIEMGLMLPNKSFKKIGEGVITEVNAFDSKIEGYLDLGTFQKIPVYYKFFSSKKHQVKIQNILDKCREKTANDDSAKILLNQKLGKDDYEYVELQSVRQRGGIMYFTYEAANGVKIPTGNAYYVQNEIDIGSYLSLDMKAARHLQTKTWQTPSGYAKSSAAITLAEGFLNSRFEFDKFNLQLGAGLFINKINTPYRNNAETPIYFQSVQKTRPAFSAKWHTYGETFWSDIRASYAPVKGRGYTLLGVDLNINITETWFVGSSLNYLSTDASGFDPSGRMMGFGLHMGFELRRKR